QESVRTHRRAVNDGADVGEIGNACRDAFDEAFRLVAARRGDLGGLHLARGLVEHENVGEGPADIDTDDKRLRAHSAASRLRILRVAPWSTSPASVIT